MKAGSSLANRLFIYAWERMGTISRGGSTNELFVDVKNEHTCVSLGR